MHESIDGRVRELELQLARVAQRVDDHEADIRSFGPLVVEQATARQAREHLGEDVHEAHEGVRRLEERFAAHIEDVGRQRLKREERERERELRDRRYRITTWIAAGGLIVTFIGLSITVLTVLHP